MDEANKKEVSQKISDASQEVEKLKKELASIDKKKEASFAKKQEVGSKIAEKIRNVNEFKKARNELTKEVRELKKKRDTLNQEINEKVQEIKKLTDGKPLPRQKRKDPENPQFLKKKIEELEYKLETQPMGFEAEQKINKQIREYKKKVNEKMKASEGMENVLAKSKEIDNLKREANALHAKVTQLAVDSQKRHENLISESKEIEELKKEEEELYNSFMEYKKKYSEINTKLKNELGEKQEVTVVRKERQESRKQKAAEDKKTLKERAKEAESKVKKKQKLTTEDLLALQGMK